MKNFIFLILLLAGCDKEFVEPPMTTNERFYCEIDGEIFRPRNEGSLYDVITDPVLYTDYNFNKPNKSITIYAFNKIQNNSSVIIYMDFRNTGLSNAKFEIKNSSSWVSYSSGYKSSLKKYDDHKSISGYIEVIKIDTLQRKISGIFEVEAKSKIDTNKIIKISKGNFNNLSY